MADFQQSICVIVVHLVLNQEPTHRLNDAPRRPLLRTREPSRVRPQTSSTASLKHPEEELERLLQSIEDAVPRNTLERLRRSMECMVPKARLQAAEAEIARLQALLDRAAKRTDLDGLREQADGAAARADADAAAARLRRAAADEDVSALRGQFDRAQVEIARLRRQLEGLDATAAAGPPADAAAAVAAAARRLSDGLRASHPPSRTGSAEDAPPPPAVRECVSVLFADIVGFTTLSGAMDAARVAGLLRRLFAAFDALALRHGVQPVDVIGDAYLAAANLLEDQPADHAARLARFAVDAAAAAAATPIADPDDPDDPAHAAAPGARLRVRVGIHCGPAVVALVGGAGGRHTLIGDTVNVASRMESSGRPGRVQCSAAMAALLAAQAPDLPVRPRPGGAFVKGKGHMETSWVGDGDGDDADGGGGSSSEDAGPPSRAGLMSQPPSRSGSSDDTSVGAGTGPAVGPGAARRRLPTPLHRPLAPLRPRPPLAAGGSEGLGAVARPPTGARGGPPPLHRAVRLPSAKLPLIAAGN
jgi:class 3 adenylate cyclase